MLINLLEEIDNMKIKKVEDDYTIRVHLKDTSLFRFSPRRMSFSERKILEEITDDLLKRKIIKPSISPYCSRVVLVTKPNGKARMCVDLRPLNQRIHPQKFPFPIIEDLLDQLYGKVVFTKLDLRDGFYQIRIHSDDTKYFSFATPTGQYEFLTMPFGYSEAPAEFQKRLLNIFDELRRQGKLLMYIDDMFIATKTVEENLEILKEVLIILKKYELELNLSKCMFLKKEIEFLGYNISEKGISLSAKHVRAILDFPQPTTVKQVQAFLGLTNYFRRFIKDYALKAKPLQDLTKSGSAFDFGDNCIRSFETLKNELTSPPILCIYNHAAETELHTDASSLGFGAILFQKQETGNMAPIAYFSKATTDVERKYHSYELETLAIVRALERFHVYLQGISFRIVTDCNSLVLAMKKININPRIARWTLTMQNYRFEMIHRSANKMMHVDALSRNIQTICAITVEDELMYRQLMDPKLKEIAEMVELKGSKKFTLIDGLLFRMGKDKPLFVVPESMIVNIIRIYHDDMGHVAVDKTIHGIVGHYWFPALKLKVRIYIDNCVKCLTYSLTAGKVEGELEIFEKDDTPMQTLHIDHFGPLERTADGYKYVLVVIDAFSKFVWLLPTKTTSSEEVIQGILSIFNLFGYPKRIISDRGSSFTSTNFKEFVKEKNIRHVLTAVASPWANGQVERVNRFLKSTLAKMVPEEQEWKNVIGKAQFVINNTLHKAVNATPSKILLGYDCRNIQDEKLREIINSLRGVDENFCEMRQQARNLAQTVNRKMQEYNKLQYDKRHKKCTRYKEGDLVMVRVTQNKPGVNKKLIPKYKGPYQIKTILKKNRFVVVDIPGYPLTSKPYNTILSPDKLKPWIRVKEPSTTTTELLTDDQESDDGL